MKEREKFSSRLGFILISAGCAIGLGNVWRFPYVVGQYGGALFVLIYLFFLVVLGAPIMTMEFSVGRASQKSAALAFQTLQTKGKVWNWLGKFQMLGNYVLMMFYTTVGGWMLSYFIKMIKGDFVGITPQQVESIFNNSLQDPLLQVFWMVVVVALGFEICSLGLQNGVEKITKIMMSSLLVIILILVIRAVTLPGGSEGLSFYLIPNFDAIKQYGLLEIIFAAMGQAFFTLSLGIGAIAIFGSYIDKNRRLFGETISVCTLDTLVALLSGLIIFPACFAFGVNPGSGPGLVFITLPSIFNEMWLGQVWGTLFFVFMSFAALSTIIAVFENIVSFSIDLFQWSRKKSVILNFIIIVIGSIPCAIGFSILSGFQPLGAGSAVLDLLDFLVSNVIMPLGSLVFLFFCTRKIGWGWKSFMSEANAGKGLGFPEKAKFYVSWILPLIVIFIFLFGLWEKLFM